MSIAQSFIVGNGLGKADFIAVFANMGLILMVYNKQDKSESSPLLLKQQIKKTSIVTKEVEVVTQANLENLDDLKSFESEPLDNSKATNLVKTKQLEKKPSFCLEPENAPSFPNDDIDTLNKKSRSSMNSSKQLENLNNKKTHKKTTFATEQENATNNVLANKLNISDTIKNTSGGTFVNQNNITGISSFYSKIGNNKTFDLDEENDNKEEDPLVVNNSSIVCRKNKTPEILDRNMDRKHTAISLSDIEAGKITLDNHNLMNVADQTPKARKYSLDHIKEGPKQDESTPKVSTQHEIGLQKGT